MRFHCVGVDCEQIIIHSQVRSPVRRQQNSIEPEPICEAANRRRDQLKGANDVANRVQVMIVDGDIPVARRESIRPDSDAFVTGSRCGAREGSIRIRQRQAFACEQIDIAG